MYKFFFKRLIDLLFSIIAFPFFILILILVKISVGLDDNGPIFYNAPRLGKNGKIFKMYKFRSMKINAPDIRNDDGSTFNSEDDPRLTKIGRFLRKTSIDEIPQILNILKGDMSIVGPRPTLSSRTFNQIPETWRDRYNVKPGLTGYSQAYFRNSITQEQKIENDIYYVNNITFMLDIKILLKTFNSVFRHSNIYNS